MTPSATVAGVLAHARRLGLDRLDAQLLLAHHLKRPRAWLIAHDDSAVPTETTDAFVADCQRRRDDWPLAYLVGQREFHGLSLQVTPAVLVPRADTEALVDWALDRLQACAAKAPHVLDLGTGSGAVALALALVLAKARPATCIHATDLSSDALAVAQDNACRLGLSVEFALGSWWEAVWGRDFDLIVSNPPYIAEGDVHLPALRREPQMALCSGVDGLDDIRQIVAGAPQHLRSDAWLLLEHGSDQAAAVSDLLRERGFLDIAGRADLSGRPRCTGGRWPKATG